MIISFANVSVRRVNYCITQLRYQTKQTDIFIHVIIWYPPYCICHIHKHELFLKLTCNTIDWLKQPKPYKI